MGQNHLSAEALSVNPPKNIGILGCGAIGSRIAKSIQREFPDLCRLSGLFDLNTAKIDKITAELATPSIKKASYEELLAHCDVLVEAISSEETVSLIRQAILARKHVLVLSVGRLLNADDLFSLAQKNHCSLLIPSGAIAGLDAVKAASLVSVTKITLTTRKPLSGFANNPYVIKQGIDLTQIKGEMTIFEGDVETAVKYFPQNINVAATLALASQGKSKLKIRLITSPELTTNSHEIEMLGDFGRILTRTENVICPDNPKTSYLAVLSGIQTLKDFCSGSRIGT